MKTKTVNSFLVLFLLTLTTQLKAQFPDWNTQGNNIVGSEWFGADATSTIPLEIRHDAFRPIVFSTDGAEHMRIAEFGNVSFGWDATTLLSATIDSLNRQARNRRAKGARKYESALHKN